MSAILGAIFIEFTVSMCGEERSPAKLNKPMSWIALFSDVERKMFDEIKYV